jgi:hypothetical protein
VDGEVYATEWELINELAQNVPADPTKPTYIFGGWFTEDGKPWDFATDEITEGLVLHVKWDLEPHTVSGTVTRSDNGAPIGGVTLYYELNGIPAYTLTDTYTGRYMISVPDGNLFTITGMEVWGYGPSPLNVYPSDVTITSDAIYDLEMDVGSFTVTIEIEDDNGTFEYSTDGGETWTPLTPNDDGEYVINVEYGNEVMIRVTPDDGYDALWNDGMPDESTGNIFTVKIADDTTVTVKFVPVPVAADDSDDFLKTLVFLMLCTIGAFMLLAMLRKDAEVKGIVTSNGEGIEGTVVEYNISGGRTGTVMTDEEGNFSIKTSLGHELTITDVDKDGYKVDGKLPATAVVEKTTAAMEIRMLKK